MSKKTKLQKTLNILWKGMNADEKQAWLDRTNELCKALGKDPFTMKSFEWIGRAQYISKNNTDLALAMVDLGNQIVAHRKERIAKVVG